MFGVCSPVIQFGIWSGRNSYGYFWHCINVIIIRELINSSPCDPSPFRPTTAATTTATLVLRRYYTIKEISRIGHLFPSNYICRLETSVLWPFPFGVNMQRDFRMGDATRIT